MIHIADATKIKLDMYLCGLINHKPACLSYTDIKILKFLRVGKTAEKLKCVFIISAKWLLPCSAVLFVDDDFVNDTSVFDLFVKELYI